MNAYINVTEQNVFLMVVMRKEQTLDNFYKYISYGKSICFYCFHDCSFYSFAAIFALLRTGSTQEDTSRLNRKIVDWDVTNKKAAVCKYIDLNGNAILNVTNTFVHDLCLYE